MSHTTSNNSLPQVQPPGGLRRRAGLSLAALVLCASSTVACRQEAPTTPPPVTDGGETDQTPPAVAEREYPPPPPASEPRPVNFPEVQEIELPNKFRTYVVENHEVPIVDIKLSVRVGDVDDPLKAEMVAAMLAEGTKKKTKAQIDETFEQLGSGLSTGAGEYTSIVGARVMSKDLDKLLAEIDDVVRNPRFEAEALEKLKEAKKAELKQIKSNGGALAEVLFGQLVYPEGHPLGRPLPTEADIDAVTTEQLAAFHATYYHPNNAHVILSGDITKDRAEKLSKKLFGFWQPAPPESFPASPLDKFTPEDYQKRLPTKLVVHVVDRPSASVEIVVGNLALARNSADWIKWAMFNRVLGQGTASRLFSDVRETLNLTYNINSSVAPAKGVGVFAIRTQSQKVSEMVNAIFKHIDRAVNEDPTEKEFDIAKSGMAQSFPLEIEVAGQIAGKVDTQITYGLAPDYWKTYRDQVLAVQRTDLRPVAKKNIHQVPIIVMVGKADKIKKELAANPILKDAQVVLYDTELRKK